MPRGASPEILKRGRARKKEVAAENQAKVKALADRLISELGPSPSTMETIHMGAIAYWTVRSEYLESIGRDSTEARRNLYQSLKAAGIKPRQPAPAPKIDMREEMLSYAKPQEARS